MLGAALVSGVAVTALERSVPIGEGTALCMFGLGVAGGMMPDLDSDHSLPVRVCCDLLAVLAGVGVASQLGRPLALLEVGALGLGTFLAVRHGLFRALTGLTVHRGLLHSIPAAVAVGLVTAILTHSQLGWSPLQAWLGACFACGGFTLHLLLDELCSVDLMGQRLKRSFGSALSLGSFRNWLGTLALYATLAALYAFTPPAEEFASRLLRPTVRELLAPLVAWAEPPAARAAPLRGRGARPG